MNKQSRIRNLLDRTFFRTLHVSRRVSTKILKFPRNYAYYNSLASFRSLSVQIESILIAILNGIHSISSSHPRQIFPMFEPIFYFSLLDHLHQIPAEYTPWRYDRAHRGNFPFRGASAHAGKNYTMGRRHAR